MMRKKNYQIEEEKAWQCFDQAPYATVAMIDDTEPYIVPLSMARIDDILYFHCAKAGRKWDVLQTNPKVCVNAVSDVTCRAFNAFYTSCTLLGEACIVTDKEEKMAALHAISEKYAKEVMDKFDAYATASLEQTGIVRIHVKNISGKSNVKN